METAKTTAFVKGIKPEYASRPVGKRGVLVFGGHRSEELQKALATVKTVEAARVIIDKANEGNPSPEVFRLRVIGIMDDAKKVVIPHEPQIPVQLLEKWFKLQDSNLCTTIAIRLGNEQKKVLEELKVAAIKAEEKAALAKAEARKEEFKKSTQKERKTHEVHLVQEGITLPLQDLAVNPQHAAPAA